MTRQTLALLLAALCLSTTARAETPVWVDKTTHAIQHGAQAAGKGIERGVHATVHGVKRGAEATGNAFHKVGEKLGASKS